MGFDGSLHAVGKRDATHGAGAGLGHTSAGTVAVTVQNPTPGGGVSNTRQFEIDSAGSNTPPTFGVITATVSPGSSATYPVKLPSGANDVSATCLNLPGGSTCGYSAAHSAVTITTSSTTP